MQSKTKWIPLFATNFVSIRQTAYKTDHLIIITEAGVPEFC